MEISWQPNLSEGLKIGEPHPGGKPEKAAFKASFLISAAILAILIPGINRNTI